MLSWSSEKLNICTMGHLFNSITVWLKVWLFLLQPNGSSYQHHVDLSPKSNLSLVSFNPKKILTVLFNNLTLKKLSKSEENCFYKAIIKILLKINRKKIIFHTLQKITQKEKLCFTSYVQESRTLLKWNELCLPVNSYVDLLILSNSKCDLFGDKVFKVIIKLKWGHYGGP